jgi:anti-sigma factor RsiW
MSCKEIERMLDPYLDGEFGERERTEADLHLGDCDGCRRFVDQQRRVREALKGKLRAAMGPGAAQGQAPATLRARVTGALERGRRPLWRRALSPVPLATLGACAAGIAVMLTTTAIDPLVEDAVIKHARDLPLEISTQLLGPEVIPAWFKGKLDFNPAPPHFQKVRMVGARLSHIQDRPAAYVRYEVMPGRPASLFIVEDRERRFGERGRSVLVGPAAVHLASQRGYNVATWRQNDVVYSLVSDLDEEGLVQIVRAAHMTGP